MKPNAVVFLGMVYPWGIIRHFALLGVELAKYVSESDYFFASISREADKDAWQLVRSSLTAEKIIETKTFDRLVEACGSLFENHEKVLVHCGGGWGQTKALIPLRKKYGKRLLLMGTTHSYQHDTAMRIPMSIFQALLYMLYYDHIVFQCPYAADRFWGARLLFAAKKASVIPLGCEPFANVSTVPPQVLAEKNGLLKVLQDQSLFKFVYLAAFRPGKKHAWLVHALAPVLRQHPEARVLFCGTGNQDVMEATARAIAAERLEDQILMTGQIPRDEVPWLLIHSNAAIVPSRAETFGHNFLEPMFASLPVLGTPVGVGRDIVRNGATGWTFSLCSYDSVRKGAELMLKDRKRTSDMGKTAHELVATEYTHEAIAKKLAQKYEELFNG